MIDLRERDWPRRKHGPLQSLSSSVSRVEGPVPGTLVSRQMIVVRDDQRRLLLHSAIALDESRQRELEQLGTTTWLVVPNGYHRLDAPAYKARYPSLSVIAPSGAAPRVKQVVHVDLLYEQFPPHPMIRFHVAPWPNPMEGVLEIRSAEGTTLVFNDLVFVPPRSGVSSWPYRLFKSGPQVPWLAKRMIMADASRLREWLLRLSSAERLVCVVPGHGDPILDDAPAALRAIAASI